MKVHPLVSLQYEYSLWTRDVESGHLAACDELGLGLMAYAPLGYGFLAGTVGGRDALEGGDTRHKFPRFADENAASNRERVDAIRKVAAAHGATPAQICIAWVLAQGGNVPSPYPAASGAPIWRTTSRPWTCHSRPKTSPRWMPRSHPARPRATAIRPDGMARVNL